MNEEIAPLPPDARSAAAEAVLTEFGIPSSALEITGHDAEIAVLTVSAIDRERLLDELRTPLVQQLKSLGFRYVAVDLEPDV